MLVITKDSQTDISSDEILRAIEEGRLREHLPSKANIPFEFSTGEKNSFDVARDRNRTYLVLHDCMETPYAMVETREDRGGYKASRMREHVHRLFEQLPEEFHMLAVTIKIRQAINDSEITFMDKAFLLSASQVFGEGTAEETDCEDEQLDFFAIPRNRLKTSHTGLSNTTWWWLRTPCEGDSIYFYVGTNGRGACDFGEVEGGVVFGICIEDRSHKSWDDESDNSTDNTEDIPEHNTHKRGLSNKAIKTIITLCSLAFSTYFILLALHHRSDVTAIIYILLSGIVAYVFLFVLFVPIPDSEDNVSTLKEQRCEPEDEQNNSRDEAAQYVDALRKFRKEIKDEGISTQLHQIEGTLERIVKKTKSDPSTKENARRLMEYYLPTTIKLLQAYIEIEDNPRKGTNVSRIMEETDESLKMLNQTMETILDNMYLGTEQDLSSDIAVMKSMMLQDVAKGEFTGLQMEAQAEDEKAAQQNTSQEGK